MVKEKQTIRILIAGEGGQGIQTIGEIMARAGFKQGKHTSYIPNFGVEQRGGVSLAFVQISDKVITFPKFQKADIMVVLAQRAVPRTSQYISTDTIYIYDSDLVKHKGVGIAATKIAGRELSPRVFNMVILGALLNLAGIRRESIVEVLDEVLGEKFKKRPELRDLNLKALDIGEGLLEDKRVK